MVGKRLTFQHFQDHRPGTRLAVVVLQRAAIGKDHGPTVMRGAVELAPFAQIGKEGVDVGPAFDFAHRSGIA